MKNLITLVFVTFSATLQAQELKVYETQKGFFIPLGDEIAYDFTYRISRKEGKQNFAVLGETSVPKSKEEYQNRLAKFQKVFPKLWKLSENQVNSIWGKINQSKISDSLRLQNPIIENLALGIAWQDTTAENNKTYQYKIERVANGQTIPSHLTEEKKYIRPQEVNLQQALYLKNEMVNDDLTVQWLMRDKTGIAGIEVYRQDNLRGGFEKINVPIGFSHNLDSTFMHVKDTMANKYEVYEYKLKAFDIFENPGAFSEPIKISLFSTHDFPVLQKFNAVALDARQIKITWSMEYKPFVRSIKILRSMSFDSEYVEIAEVSPRDSTFTDVLPISMENYHYRLRINGPDDVSISTAATYIHYESDIAPERPNGFAARTIKDGVELYWEDKQRNVFGYYIYRKERDEEFLQISEPVLKNENGVYHFKDSTSNLHGDRFYDYAVKTISDSYTLSQYSDTLSVRPGVEVVTNVPTNFRGRKADGKVFLMWDDLSQRENNLWGYKVFRKKSIDSTYTAITDTLLQQRTNHFIDSTMEQGYAYEYAVKAYNYFGGESELSNTVQFQFFLRLPTPPSSVQAQKLSTGIRVVWGDVMVPELAGFNLYRYTPDKKPVLIKNVSADQHDFVDDQVEHGKLYFYYVTSSNAEKIEGRPSKKVSVRY